MKYDTFGLQRHMEFILVIDHNIPIDPFMFALGYCRYVSIQTDVIKS